MPPHLDEVLTQTKRFYTAKTLSGHYGNDEPARHVPLWRGAIPGS